MSSIFELLKTYRGPLTINKESFNTLEEAHRAYGDYNGGLNIILNPQRLSRNSTEAAKSAQEAPQLYLFEDKTKTYSFRMGKYMREYTKDNFLYRLNNYSHPPLLHMKGKIIAETNGLVKADLYGFLPTEANKCIRCGSNLTPLDIHNRYCLCKDCVAALNINSPVSAEDLENKLKEIHWQGNILKKIIVIDSIMKYSDNF